MILTTSQCVNATLCDPATPPPYLGQADGCDGRVDAVAWAVQGGRGMSYNIDTIDTLCSTLRISRKNAEKAISLTGLPEIHPLDDIDGLEFGDDGYAKIERFSWCGEGSGWAFKSTLRKFVALLEGDADLILTWEGGDSHSGVRIRGGKMTQCEVVMTLAPEK